MKERVVVLFLFAMGTIKIYENFGDDEDRDEDDKDQDLKRHKIGRRSVWDEGESSDDDESPRKIPDFENSGINWSLYFEEVVEAGSPQRQGPHCLEILDDECSCRRLVCYGERSCLRNLTHAKPPHPPSPPHAPIDGALPLPGAADLQPKPLQPPKASMKEKMLQCRHTIMFGENLCECKRYTREFDVNNVAFPPPLAAAASSMSAQPAAALPSAVMQQARSASEKDSSSSSSFSSDRVRRFHERRNPLHQPQQVAP